MASGKYTKGRSGGKNTGRRYLTKAKRKGSVLVTVHDTIGLSKPLGQSIANGLVVECFERSHILGIQSVVKAISEEIKKSIDSGEEYFGYEEIM